MKYLDDTWWTCYIYFLAPKREELNRSRCKNWTMAVSPFLPLREIPNLRNYLTNFNRTWYYENTTLDSVLFFYFQYTLPVTDTNEYIGIKLYTSIALNLMAKNFRNRFFAIFLISTETAITFQKWNVYLSAFRGHRICDNHTSSPK